MELNQPALRFLRSGPIAHVVTLNHDGSPHVSMAWVDVEEHRLLIGTLFDQRKLRNLRRDPRVAVSFESDVTQPSGLREYLVVHGRAEVTEGGAAALLARLAERYIGPGTPFPPMPDPPEGYITRITVERLTGIGPWMDPDN